MSIIHFHIVKIYSILYTVYKKSALAINMARYSLLKYKKSKTLPRVFDFFFSYTIISFIIYLFTYRSNCVFKYI